jgi:transcriptional regulator GlxA family with amidase domain
VDTLLVAGGSGVHPAAATPSTVAAVKRLSGRARRTASVCTGAFLLAQAGLLDGRRATTHWASAQRLAERHPEVTVDPDPIFVRDGDTWTSAGVTAGMDLTLALVEDDLGPDVAVAVARWLVLFAKRPGGQAQFSTPLSAQAAERRPLRAVQDHVRAHPEGDLSVERLAGRAHMSTRNFARAFRQEVGATPGAFVEAVRLERAKQMLEATETSVDQVARDCGFGTPETLRRVFARRLGVTPSDYRDRFRLAAEAA